jgi:putative flippase GtrA
VVGGGTAVIYAGLITVLVNYLRLDYRFGLTLAYITAVSFHFTANRYLTFRSYKSRLLTQILRYSMAAFVNYVITLVMVFVIVDKLHQDAYVGSLVSLFLTVVLGYFFARLWIFQTGRTTHG